MRSTRLMLGMAILMAIGAVLLLGSVSDTTEAKKNKNPEVTFEFSVTYAKPQIPTEIVALVLCAANIGSSGEDGVTTCPDGATKSSDFQVDSFFDVEYRVIFGDPDFATLSTIDIEIVALQLKSVDPVTVIGEVEKALSAADKPKEYIGHVTLIK